MTFCRSIICFTLYLQGAFATFEHARENSAINVLDYVDPLIGSRSGGNVFAGATLPYGMAKGSLGTENLTKHH